MLYRAKLSVSQISAKSNLSLTSIAAAACIEQGHPARLKELYLYDMGPTTWSVREIRRLAEACRRREIALVVG